MKSSNWDLYQLFFLLVGTAGAYFVTLWVLELLFPEQGPVALRGIFLGLIYMAFFFVTVIPLGIGKALTIKILVRNLIACFAAPYIFFALLSLIASLK